MKGVRAGNPSSLAGRQPRSSGELTIKNINCVDLCGLRHPGGAAHKPDAWTESSGGFGEGGARRRRYCYAFGVIFDMETPPVSEHKGVTHIHCSSWSVIDGINCQKE